MADLQDHMRSGMAHGYALLDAVEADRGDEAAMAFCAGIVCAAARWNTKRRGMVSTHEMLTGLADETIDPLLDVAGQA